MNEKNKITKNWLENNHFKLYGDWYELNTLNLNLPKIENQIFVSLKHETIEISSSSTDDSMILYIPFTIEALTKFISSYGCPRKKLLK